MNSKDKVHLVLANVPRNLPIMSVSTIILQRFLLGIKG
jgi:hypothetical protein